MKKTAWITGSGKGNGKGMALRLAEIGYDVGLHCNASMEGMEDTLSAIRGMGRNAVAIQANLSDRAQIARLFREWEAAMGCPDLFVNNSGITRTAPFLETEETMFDEVCGVNIKGAYFCMQEAAECMKRNGVRGSIIAIGSNHGVNQFCGGSVYGMFKAALAKLTRHAAVEVAQYGIRVNAIAPGYIVADRSTKERMAATYPAIPMHRWVRPEEIADLADFLACPSALSITGNCIVMDGGNHLMSAGSRPYGFEEME